MGKEEFTIDFLKLKLNPNPSKRVLRRMGLSADHEGIANRFAYERLNWKPHILNTKDYLVHCLKATNANTVSVLGSGWLFDIPVEFLAENYERVYFYDIRHPKQILHKYRKQKNFHFIEFDLTGGFIDWTYYNVLTKNTTKPESLHAICEKVEVELPYSTDFILSVNLLNQLDILLIEALELKFPGFSLRAAPLHKAIQDAHIRLLRGSPSCMVTDYEEMNYDKLGNLIKTTPLIYLHIPNEQIERQWLWTFDTQGTYRPGMTTNMKVMGVNFSKNS